MTALDSRPEPCDQFLRSLSSPTWLHHPDDRWLHEGGEWQAGPFQRVWSIVKRVPRGRVVTYGQLSEMIQHRLSPVGIGWAIRAAAKGSIPWHRVVNAQGGVSTDRQHPGLQRSLLEAEGVRFDREGRVDLARVGWKPRKSA